MAEANVSYFCDMSETEQSFTIFAHKNQVFPILSEIDSFCYWQFS